MSSCDDFQIVTGRKRKSRESKPSPAREAKKLRRPFRGGDLRWLSLTPGSWSSSPSVSASPSAQLPGERQIATPISIKVRRDRSFLSVASQSMSRSRQKSRSHSQSQRSMAVENVRSESPIDVVGEAMEVAGGAPEGKDAQTLRQCGEAERENPSGESEGKDETTERTPTPTDKDRQPRVTALNRLHGADVDGAGCPGDATSSEASENSERCRKGTSGGGTDEVVDVIEGKRGKTADFFPSSFQGKTERIETGKDPEGRWEDRELDSEEGGGARGLRRSLGGDITVLLLADRGGVGVIERVGAEDADQGGEHGPAKDRSAKEGVAINPEDDRRRRRGRRASEEVRTKEGTRGERRTYGDRRSKGRGGGRYAGGGGGAEEETRNERREGREDDDKVGGESARDEHKTAGREGDAFQFKSKRDGEEVGDGDENDQPERKAAGARGDVDLLERGRVGDEDDRGEICLGASAEVMFGESGEARIGNERREGREDSGFEEGGEEETVDGGDEGGAAFQLMPERNEMREGARGGREEAGAEGDGNGKDQLERKDAGAELSGGQDVDFLERGRVGASAEVILEIGEDRDGREAGGEAGCEAGRGASGEDGEGMSVEGEVPGGGGGTELGDGEGQEITDQSYPKEVESEARVAAGSGVDAGGKEGADADASGEVAGGQAARGGEEGSQQDQAAAEQVGERNRVTKLEARKEEGSKAWQERPQEHTETLAVAQIEGHETAGRDVEGVRVVDVDEAAQEAKGREERGMKERNVLLGKEAEGGKKEHGGREGEAVEEGTAEAEGGREEDMNSQSPSHPQEIDVACGNGAAVEMDLDSQSDASSSSCSRTSPSEPEIFSSPNNALVDRCLPMAPQPQKQVGVGVSDGEHAEYRRREVLGDRDDAQETFERGKVTGIQLGTGRRGGGGSLRRGRGGSRARGGRGGAMGGQFENRLFGNTDATSSFHPGREMSAARGRGRRGRGRGTGPAWRPCLKAMTEQHEKEEHEKEESKGGKPMVVDPSESDTSSSASSSSSFSSSSSSSHSRLSSLSSSSSSDGESESDRSSTSRVCSVVDDVVVREDSQEVKGKPKTEHPKRRVRKSVDDLAELTWEWVCTASVPTIRHIPKGARQTWSEVLEARVKKAVENGSTYDWKLLLALPKLCLRSPPRGGKKKKIQRLRSTEWMMGLLCRARQGKWAELVAEAKAAEKKTGHKTGGGERMVRERVMMLVEEGQYSKAVKALLSEGVCEAGEKVIEELRGKHPQRDEWKKVAEQKEGPGESSEWSFNEDEVWKALKGFPRGTAPGGSGGRAQHWLDALEILPADARKRILGPLASLCTQLANGRAPGDVAQWMAGAPVFPLKKKGGGGIRPIAVGEVLRRLVGRLLVNKPEIKEKTAELFEKVGQLGVGVKGGAEIAVQLMRTWLEKKNRKGWGVLKIDFENAYNSLDRSAIEQVLREEFPELVSWFRYCYGVPAVLSCQGKRLPFDSRTGIQQGDPLGPLFFACGILLLCRRTMTELKDTLALWYLDDGSMAGPGEELVKAWDLIQEESRKIGLRVNARKCEIWTAEGTDVEWLKSFPEEVVRVPDQGFELLGAPIGSSSFCREFAEKRVRRVKEVIDRLPELDDPQMELILLRSCIGFPKFGFTLRSAPPEDIEAAAKSFDAMIEKTSEDRFGIQMGKETSMQWHLPVRMGGVGIPRAQDVSTPAYLGNVLLALPFLRKMIEEKLVVEDVPGARFAWGRLSEVVIEKEKDLPAECEVHLKSLKVEISPETLEKLRKGPSALEDLCPEEESAEAGGTDQKEMKGKKKKTEKCQHFLHSLIHVKRVRQWLAESASQDDDDDVDEQKRNLIRKMAVMRDDPTTGCAGSWLNVVPCRALGTRMVGAVFNTALRWWVGASTWQAEVCGVRAANGRQCGKELDKWGDHAVICPFGPGRIARHNAVNMTWLAAEKTAGFSVSREVGIKTEERSHKRQADTLVYDWEGGACCAQDWVVAHIMTKAELKAKSADPNRAVIDAEKGKEKREGGKCEKVVGIKYLPMAVDTFGGFGPNAMGAMERVANEMRVAKDMDPQISTKRLAQKLRVVVMSHVANELLRRSKFPCDEMDMQSEVEALTRKCADRAEEEEDEPMTETEEDAKESLSRGGEKAKKPEDMHTEERMQEPDKAVSEKVERKETENERKKKEKKREEVGRENKKVEMEDVKARKQKKVEEVGTENKKAEKEENMQDVNAKKEKKREEVGQEKQKRLVKESTQEGNMEWSADHGAQPNQQKAQPKMEKAVSGCPKKPTGKWEEWRKQDSPTSTIDDLKMTLYRLAREEGMEVFDVGQGRGGECQFLAVLCSIDPTSRIARGKRYEWDYQTVDAFRAAVADWMRSHGDKWIGGETLRTLALMECGRWREGMSLEAEQKQWERYLAGVAHARFQQWGDHFTILAVSGLLKRMVVVRSVGASKTLSMFEIEPPDHVSGGESSGVPLILSHLRDHHYLPVRIQRDGPWGWVVEQDVPNGKAHFEKDGPVKMLRDVEMHVPPVKEELTSSRNHSPQRRSVLQKGDESRARGNRLSFESSPMSGRIFSPQRRLVLRDLVRRGSGRRSEVGSGLGSYAGAAIVGRSLSVDKWFSERALSLARGAESEEEEWLSAWGVVPKEKGRRGEVKEGESYAGRSLLVRDARDTGLRTGVIVDDAFGL